MTSHERPADPLILRLHAVAAMGDPVDRSHAYEALLSDALTRVDAGHDDAAVAVLESLAALDEGDDLLQAVQGPAVAALEAIGRRTPVSLDDIASELQARFSGLPDAARHLAIATSLHRSHQHDRSDALELALRHLAMLGAGPQPPKVRALEADIRRALVALSREP